MTVSNWPEAFREPSGQVIDILLFYVSLIKEQNDSVVLFVSDGSTDGLVQTFEGLGGVPTLGLGLCAVAFEVFHLLDDCWVL